MAAFFCIKYRRILKEKMFMLFFLNENILYIALPFMQLYDIYSMLRGKKFLQSG